MAGQLGAKNEWPVFHPLFQRMLGLCEMLFIPEKQFLSFRLISDSEEENNGQRRKVLVSKNGGSSSSDHPKPLLKQNGVCNHVSIQLSQASATG